MGIYWLDEYADTVERLDSEADTAEGIRAALDELSQRFSWEREADRIAFIEEHVSWEDVWACNDPFEHECAMEYRPLTAQTRYALECKSADARDRI